MSNTQINTLTDKLGRSHDYLRISLTERCNLRCVYCMPADGIPLRSRDSFMRREEILEIAKTFCNLGVRKIRLTGGEPLIRKDAREIISDLSKLNVELAITTNGILVDKFIDTFKNAGIKSINISLDSLNEDKQAQLSRRNYFDKIISNIQLLIAEGFKVKINTVLLGNINEDEILDFVNLTKDKDVEVRFIEFMPFKGNEWEWDAGVSLDKVITEVAEHFGKDKLIKSDGKPNDTAKIYSIKDFKGSFGVISTVTSPFCAGCNRIRLTADGKMKNCLFSTGETDLLAALRNEENIVPLIIQNISLKKAQRGGMTTFDEFSDPVLNLNNRSMIAIGG